MTIIERNLDGCGAPTIECVYRVGPSTVFALGTSEPFGATRFQLG
jgi:hypothetical protein